MRNCIILAEGLEALKQLRNEVLKDSTNLGSLTFLKDEIELLNDFILDTSELVDISCFWQV